MITDLGPVDEDGDYSVIEEAAVCWKLLASVGRSRARGVRRTVCLPPRQTNERAVPAVMAIVATVVAVGVIAERHHLLAGDAGSKERPRVLALPRRSSRRHKCRAALL
jgi:hypothetical protein